jgi:hypothetical protein
MGLEEPTQLTGAYCSSSLVGMAVQVTCLMGAGLVHFCSCDLNLNLTRAEPGFGAAFVFYSWVYLKSEKNLKLERNLKKTQNLKKKNSKHKRNLKEI